MSALKKYYQELINELEQNEYKGGCLLGNMMGEVGDTSDLCRTALNKAVGRYGDIQEKALERAQSEGVVRTDRTAKSMASLLLTNWQGALLRMKIERSVQPFGRVL